MKKFLVFAAAMMVVAGCTKSQVSDAGNKVGCAVQDAVVGVTTVAVANELACKNQDAIKVYLVAQASKANICKPAPAPSVSPAAAGAMSIQSAAGDMICAPLVESLTSGALATIPADWGCTGGAVTDTVKAKLLAACQKAL